MYYNPYPPYNYQTPQPTQPPQPVSKIIPVSNKNEATAYQVDLVYGFPTFFYNKVKNEIYLKQFDVQNGNAIFKVFGEIQPVEEPLSNVSAQKGINIYEKEFNRLNEGIDSLHRMIAKLQQFKDDEVIEIEPVDENKFKNKKRGQ